MAKQSGYSNGTGRGVKTPVAPTKFVGKMPKAQTPPTDAAPLRQRYKMAGGGGK